MNTDVKKAHVHARRPGRIVYLKNMIRDQGYLDSAINKIAAELTVFLYK